jgi:predicted GH43/DUF377 family glycosyl hydrolase
MLKILSNYIRKCPLLYTAIYRLRFIFSPTRFIGRIVSLPAHLKHICKSYVIAGPNYLGFKGGIYNPGGLPIGEDGFLLLAKGQFCHWWDAVGVNANMYYMGYPVLITLDEKLKIKNSQIIKNMKCYGDNENVGYEDFRMFNYNEEIWVNHSKVPISRKNNCVATFNQASQCLSKLDLSSNTLEFIGHPQLEFEIKRIEKNWLYFEYEGELYMFYSFHPYCVLKLTDRNQLYFSIHINKTIRNDLGDLGGFRTMVSFSTNPIEYDDSYLLLLVHQVEPSIFERIYHHWGVLINKQSLLPVKITKKPLYSGYGARGRKPGIIYVTSLVKRGEEIIAFNGEGDAYLTWAPIKKEYLDSCWVDITFGLECKEANSNVV